MKIDEEYGVFTPIAKFLDKIGDSLERINDSLRSIEDAIYMIERKVDKRCGTIDENMDMD